MTDRGERAIGEIKVGDRVLAYNEETGETGYYTVEAVLAHEDKVIERLTVGGEGLETTPEHPFYTRERGWVPAGKLAVGLHVRTAEGSYAVVEGIRLERRAERMFNLTVDEAHTFFVGEQQLLVHNTCGVPQAAYDTLSFLDAHNYSPPPNYSGGRVFGNWNGALPAGGDYREYDIYPNMGGNRGSERIVVDVRTGAAWYTPDHYTSFEQIR
jgi:hypothetical protein